MSHTLSQKTLDVLAFVGANHNPRESHTGWSERYAALCERYSEKAVARKLDQLADKDWIDYGVSARMGWLTDEGHAVLASNTGKKP